MLLHSLPNIIVSTLKLFRILMLLSANVSADWVPKRVGNSNTMSMLFSKAILVLSSLVRIEISPRSKKYPFNARIMIESGYCSLILSIWYKCPLWNGLYSAIIPIVFILFLQKTL